MKCLKKIKPIQQLNQLECGICCLKMILDYYKSYIPLADIREKLDSSFQRYKHTKLKKSSGIF